MIELIAVIAVSLTLSTVSNVISRRFRFGERVRSAFERAALETLEKRDVRF